MSQITSIHAREVLDSRGRPTVEVDIHCGEHLGRAIVPSGASTGSAEALELRDGEARYAGRGVRRAVAHVNDKIAPQLIGVSAADQFEIDQRMLDLDGTPQKARLGGNAILGVSMAAAHAAAASQRIPLWRHFHDLLGSRHPQEAPAPRMPIPMTNMISGGLHAGGNLDFQDILALPVREVPYAEMLEWLVRIYWKLGELLADAGHEGRLVGDEGGFGPKLTSNRRAVEFVVQAIESAGLKPAEDVAIAMDVAATHFAVDGGYRLATEDQMLSSEEVIDRLDQWRREFPIISIEDGLAEEDWDGWTRLTERMGDSVRLVGDDLFTTNCERIRRGVELAAGNSVLIKVNQIGTITETLDAVALSRREGFSFVVSARSGETEDATIADLAVGVAAPEIKIGSIVRGERLSKYNQLLRIEERLLNPS